MAAKRKRAKQASTPKTRGSEVPAAVAGTESGVIEMARQLRDWTDSVLGIAGAAADASLSAAKAILVRPEQRAALARAGAVLRKMREGAGLSLREVGSAINLGDPTLLELVESGKVALPFEITLRLASVLARNDPISFVMNFTRSYNPEVWKTLEKLGIGRLAVQAGRERELANVYRASDVARRLSDADFAAVLAFTRQAFDMAVAFRAGTPHRLGGRRATARASTA